MIVLIKLLLAHFVGDFFLQTKKLVEDKQDRRWRSPFLYLHSLLHGILAWAILAEVKYWYIALTIVLTHFSIDLGKVIYDNGKPGRKSFLIDQLLHLLVILALYIFSGNLPIKDYLNELFSSQLAFYGFTLSLIILTLPSAHLLKAFFSRYNIEFIQDDLQTLPGAGMYIGMLERFLVFLFIITDYWEGIGFLITAKSVFRFGDLSKSKNMQLTEYVLMGTLLSFTIAIITGILFRLLV
jgi:hypothetical protein